METGPLYVGIDVSKAQLDIAERPSGEQAVIPHTEQAIAALRRGRRGGEATLAEAFLHCVNGRADKAIACLTDLLDRPELPFAGWTIPVEPLFEPLGATDSFHRVLARLAERAR